MWIWTVSNQTVGLKHLKLSSLYLLFQRHDLLDAILASHKHPEHSRDANYNSNKEVTMSNGKSNVSLNDGTTANSPVSAYQDTDTTLPIDQVMAQVSAILEKILHIF